MLLNIVYGKKKTHGVNGSYDPFLLINTYKLNYC